MLLGCLLKVWGEVGGCRGQGGGPEGRVGQASEVGVEGGLCREDPRAGEVRVAGGPGALPPCSRDPGVAEVGREALRGPGARVREARGSGSQGAGGPGARWLGGPGGRGRGEGPGARRAQLLPPLGFLLLLLSRP